MSDEHTVNQGNTSSTNVIEKMTFDKIAEIKVNEYNNSYIGDFQNASDIYFSQRLGSKLRTLEIISKGARVQYEKNKLHSIYGKFEDITTNMSDMVSGITRKKNDDSFIMPTIETGRNLCSVTLSANMNYITLLEVKETVVVDNGLLLAMISNPQKPKPLKSKTKFNTKIKDLAFNNRNMLESAVDGRGILALELPVLPKEVIVYKITPDRPLYLAQDTFLWREGNVKRDIHFTSKNAFSVMTSGDGYIEEYTGNGKVFASPTRNAYMSKKEVEDKK